MACYTVVKPGQTQEARKEQVKKSLSRLEKALTEKRVKVRIGPNGAVAFAGWKPEERDDVTDVCAFRTLTTQNSWALRQAVAAAEQEQGRKVNTHAVAAGIHSHDGGKTWGKGH